MGIRKRGGQWHYRFRYNGQDFSGTTGLGDTERNRKAALEFETRERRQMKEYLALGAPSKLLFVDAAADYLHWAEHTRYKSSRSTYLRIRVSFTSLIGALGLQRVVDLDAAQIEQYKTWRLESGVREVSLRHDLHAFSLFFQYAERMKWRTGNPVRQVDMPSDKDAVRINPIDSETEEKYFAIAKRIPNLYDLGRLMLQQGCRPEEIMHLRAADVDTARGQMQIRGGKTPAARRILYLTAESMEILERRSAAVKGERADWLFPSPVKPGHPIQKLACSHDRVCLEAGVSFVLYDLRHSFATRFVESGGDIVTLAALLGHKGLTIVMKYAHPSAGHKKEAMRKFEAAQLRKIKRVI